ncbi:MAG: DUF2207 domain-containing protein [Caldisericia bacterium]|jgi:uncharacterized membrane protein|nr:DUF2207 domain-containing protein [Caldisericia bacterium]
MKRLIFLLIFFIISISINVRPLYAKDYYFKRVYTEIYINKDGSFDVNIERTYHFSGSFSWATYYIYKKGFEEIQDFSLRDEFKEYERTNFDTQREGTYIFEDWGDRFYIKFYYSAKDEDKTFYFKYKVIGGIKSYLDISDFYWKVIEDEWERDTKEFECKIYLPKEINKDDFYIFAHGPLWGEIEKLDGIGARLYIKDLPKETFVEARILFPSEILDQEKIYQYKLDEILNYERDLAKKSNLIRLKVKFLYFLIIFIPIILILIWLFLLRRFGIEHRIVKNYEYFREPPDNLDPAIVGYLMNWKNVSSKEFIATLMDLIRKGYIEVESIKKEVGTIFKKEKDILIFKKTQKDPSFLKSYEKIIYDFLFTNLVYEDLLKYYNDKRKLKFYEKLIKEKDKPLSDFAGRNEISVSSIDIENYIRRNPKEFKTVFDAFCEAVKENGSGYDFFEEKGFKIGIITMVLSLAYFIFSIIIIGNFNLPNILLFYSIISSSILILISTFMPRRSLIGAKEFNKWNAFKKFLKDFSNLKEAIPLSIILWEKYLIYATLFGISERVLNELKYLIPKLDESEIRKSSLFSIAYHGGVYDFSGISTNLNSLVSTFNSMSKIAASSLSSSGGGGGFSGGGGGGGGSGGGGAG